MKKVLLFILLLVPMIFVSAAATPRIITLEAESTDSLINYNGTIEPGSHAVMCKLYDDKETELDMLSSAVDEQKFEGSFTVTESGDYVIACANYEGGDIKTTDVTVDIVVPNEKNAKTFDAGIKGSLIALGISGIGIAAYFVTKKKNKKASK